MELGVLTSSLMLGVFISWLYLWSCSMERMG